jgi:hypothetical protein
MSLCYVSVDLYRDVVWYLEPCCLCFGEECSKELEEAQDDIRFAPFNEAKVKARNGLDLLAKENGYCSRAYCLSLILDQPKDIKNYAKQRFQK